MKAVCTALSVVETHCISANMKEEALKMAAFYEGNIKIEINTNKINGLVKISVTEYNV
ncbi:hypothetical protein LCGC14_1295570 [marine sediment metagenome]|uniref:Uncharacterized protein n=1 Tax=marine sediment metagenome TaxID=412755 RepID=A0A0F9KSY4_9ZZZZ